MLVIISSCSGPRFLVPHVLSSDAFFVEFYANFFWFLRPANKRGASVWGCVIDRLYPGYPSQKGKPHIDVLLQKHGGRSATKRAILFSCGSAAGASHQESRPHWCRGSRMMHVGYLAALVGIFQSIILSLLRLDGNLHQNQDALRATAVKKNIFYAFFPPSFHGELNL